MCSTKLLFIYGLTYHIDNQIEIVTFQKPYHLTWSMASCFLPFFSNYRAALTVVKRNFNSKNSSLIVIFCYHLYFQQKKMFLLVFCLKFKNFKQYLNCMNPYDVQTTSIIYYIVILYYSIYKWLRMAYINLIKRVETF